jgi:hypothetical protein
MNLSREQIVELIERHAHTATPPVDPTFVERLERRLRSLDLTPVKSGPRRIGRFTVTAVVAGTMIAGAAAAAGVVTLRHSTESPAATSETTAFAAPSTTISPVPVTTSPSLLPVATAAVTTSSMSAPVTTSAVPPATTPQTPTTLEPTTLPPAPVTTSPATTSTEVRVAATLTLTCAPATTTIDCSWDAGPDGTTHYVVLRTDPTSTNGRVFTPEPGATSYVDTLVVAGTAYTYLVHALDSTEHSLAHSDRVAVPCCG